MMISRLIAFVAVSMMLGCGGCDPVPPAPIPAPVPPPMVDAGAADLPQPQEADLRPAVPMCIPCSWTEYRNCSPSLCAMTDGQLCCVGP